MEVLALERRRKEPRSKEHGNHCVLAAWRLPMIDLDMRQYRVSFEESRRLQQLPVGLI